MCVCVYLVYANPPNPSLWRRCNSPHPAAASTRSGTRALLDMSTNSKVVIHRKTKRCRVNAGQASPCLRSPVIQWRSCPVHVCSVEAECCWRYPEVMVGLPANGQWLIGHFGVQIHSPEMRKAHLWFVLHLPEQGFSSAEPRLTRAAWDNVMLCREKVSNFAWLV